MLNRRITAALTAFALLMLTAALLLNSQESPALAQTTRDPCRDELGNETCEFFGVNEGRINLNSETAPLAGYCEQGGVTLYLIRNGKGDWQFNASAAEITAAVTQAVNTKKAVNVRTAGETALVAQPSGQLVMVHTPSGYSYSFPPVRCGISAPVGDPNAPNQVPAAGSAPVGANTGGTSAPGAAVAPVETIQADGALVYTVQAGDTLSGIAAKYNTTVAELRRLNSLPGDSSLIVQGAKLIVKAGTGNQIITGTPGANGTPIVLPTSTARGSRVIIVTATFTRIASATPRMTNTSSGRATVVFPTKTRPVTRTAPATNTPRPSSTPTAGG